MSKEYSDYFYENYVNTDRCVSMRMVGQWFKRVFSLCYPVSRELTFSNREQFDQFVKDLEQDLIEIISCSMNPSDNDITDIVQSFFQELPTIKQTLDTDVTAICEGDPAAQSIEEVVRCYPGIQAIAAYRFAHVLHQRKVPVIPRMITEYAHGTTGIDIHPAAKIGKHFFIDHGTGVVIGATAQIGEYVKIYQGVTLGGLSVRKEDAKAKRHPTIEDNVVIYAGATILGGDTIIGKGAIIGGNTFITKSIDPSKKVYHNPTNQEK